MYIADVRNRFAGEHFEKVGQSNNTGSYKAGQSKQARL